MTNEQINRAIAEVCGWHSITTTGIHGIKGPLRGYMQIPDYCTDLNAMHEAEKVLNAEQWQLFAAWLFKATAKPQHATARQRAEAFLRALGKWEEVQS